MLAFPKIHGERKRSALGIKKKNPLKTQVFKGMCFQDTIEKIIELYSTCGKQVIIALDKQDSYSEKTSALLSDAAVLKLAKGGQELFGRSWG